MSDIYLSKEKIEELKKEVKKLIEVDRPKIIESIKVARAQGDLSENADYDAAKDQQGEIEARIAEIETILGNYQVINDQKKSDVITIGKTVTFYDESDKENYTYEIVGEIEANPSENKISNISPLARAIIGKKVGDRVSVTNIEKPYFIEIKSVS
ncbi:MAG: transcription elongation factor GreA [Mycoplasmataceae bacterium]|jgi:transcription elongation factor GreA|nr:transcription elongation factor GreA [Mycoplasmataceae bacterium]